MGTGARRAVIAILLALGAGTLPHGARAQSDDLRRELEVMRKQLRQMQEQMKEQQELIDKLSAEKQAPAAPPTAQVPATKTAEEKAADEERLRREITASIMRRVQPQIAAANKTFPSQFNPAIGLIIDTVGSYGSKTRGDFELRAAELGISASVDPFARGYAIITGSNAGGFDVEEAAIVTTSLPYNLTVKGGRFFADFGRLSKFHDHDLPFVNRPGVLDTYIGGESQSDGIEVNWLAPLDQYLTLTAGVYNKVGASNTRVDNTVPRGLEEFTYLARATTFFSLTDAQSIDLGVSNAYTPRVRVNDGGSRNLAGIDLTYRYTPLAAAAYRGLVWGNEFLLNSERQQTVPASDTGPALFRYRDAFGMYSYLEARLTRRYYPGVLFEWVEDLAHPGRVTNAYSPYFTVWASEFQRLRLQYTHLDAPRQRPEDQFFLQWTIIMGSHVHSFRDR